MDRKARGGRRLVSRTMSFGALLLCLSVTVASSSGCIGLIANLIHGAVGDLTPARYDGLKEKRVAVVCVSSTDAYFGPISFTDQLAIKIGEKLKTNVKEIEVIDNETINNWIDEHDWNQNDYEAIGRGVDAQMLLVVELDSYSLHEGQTMYKGRANTALRVLDMENNGEVVFQTDPSMVEFPTHAGYHTTEMTSVQFERLFIMETASRLARNFYAYNRLEDVAMDPPNLRP